MVADSSTGQISARRSALIHGRLWPTSSKGVLLWLAHIVGNLYATASPIFVPVEVEVGA